jgi:hypothetical protein
VRGNLVPTSTKSTDLGSSSLYWNNIYGVKYYCNGSTTNIVSDKRLKEIQDNNLLERDLNVYDNLTPVVFKYKNIFNEDNHDRNHIGFIAQDVEQVIRDQGLTNMDCALVSALPVDHDLDVFTDGKKYYLGLEELHGLHVLKNQRQDKEINSLKEEIKQLK